MGTTKMETYEVLDFKIGNRLDVDLRHEWIDLA